MTVWPSRKNLPPSSGCLCLVLSVVALCSCTRFGHDADDEKKATTTTSPATKEADEGQKIKLSADAIERYGVRTGRVKIHLLTPTFIAPARIAFNGNATARVGSVVPGRVVDIKVQRGDIVKKGDELMTVESTDLGESQSDFLLKRTTLDTTTAAIEPVKVSYDRAKKLYDQSQGISLSELQKREAELRAAEAAQQLAKGAMSASERKLSLYGMSKDAIDQMAKTGQVTPRYIVRSPINGSVIEREVTIGQFIAPDKDSPVLIADLSTLWVLADVPEARLGDLTLGAAARVTFSSLGASAVDGILSSISPSVDPSTRTVQARIEVKSADTALKPGMFAQVEIDAITEKDKARDAIAIPEAAVQMIDGKPCVFVKDDDEENTFIKRPIAIGSPVSGLIPVLSGLEVKETIVKSGGFILKAEAMKSAVKEAD
jgi:cobalt-zinc-cadmium efflux system membrane fusion protein